MLDSIMSIGQPEQCKSATCYDPKQTMLQALEERITQLEESANRFKELRKKMKNEEPLATFTREDMSLLRSL